MHPQVLLDQPGHPFVVRALPIDLFAGRADLELIEIKPGQRLQPLEHSLLCDRLQGMVAAQAAMKGSDPFCQVKALDHFRELLQRLEGAQAVSDRNRLSHEQAPVPAEKDAAFLLG